MDFVVLNALRKYTIHRITNIGLLSNDTNLIVLLTKEKLILNYELDIPFPNVSGWLFIINYFLTYEQIGNIAWNSNSSL